MRRGADVTLRDEDGNLPIDKARERSHREIIRLIESQEELLEQADTPGVHTKVPSGPPKHSLEPREDRSVAVHFVVQVLQLSSGWSQLASSPVCKALLSVLAKLFDFMRADLLADGTCCLSISLFAVCLFVCLLFLCLSIPLLLFVYFFIFCLFVCLCIKPLIIHFLFCALYDHLLPFSLLLLSPSPPASSAFSFVESVESLRLASLCETLLSVLKSDEAHLKVLSLRIVKLMIEKLGDRVVNYARRVGIAQEISSIVKHAKVEQAPPPEPEEVC